MDDERSCVEDKTAGFSVVHIAMHSAYELLY